MTVSESVCVVMGGSSGVGLATAELLVRQRASVWVTGRSEERLEAVRKNLPEVMGAEAVDASHLDAVRELYGKIGTFDHLVVCVTGAEGGGSFRELDVQALRRAFDAKFFAQFTAAQAAIDHLSSAGSITFVSAASARTSLAGTSGLAALNGALEALIPPLALELAPRRVNAVSPGVIATPWWNTLSPDQRRAVFEQSAASVPVGRVGEPEDVAHAIAFLVDNTFMTGTVIECDGGIRIK